MSFSTRETVAVETPARRAILTIDMCRPTPRVSCGRAEYIPSPRNIKHEIISFYQGGKPDLSAHFALIFITEIVNCFLHLIRGR
jgi:hypothetical protein